MKVESTVVCSIVFIGIFYFFLPVRGQTETPTALIRATVDKVFTILKDQHGITNEERRKQLRQVIYPRFNFREMAVRSLGVHWRRRTPEEQQEFLKVFVNLIQDTYVRQIESFTDEKVVYIGEAQDKEYAEVKTRIVTKKGEEFSLNYRLLLTNGDWKVYDVVIENISLVNNYRSQFNRIITKSSYEELLRRMREKNLEMKTKVQK